jgi:hypothetical protein
MVMINVVNVVVKEAEHGTEKNEGVSRGRELI